jgi:hypothetical protein
LAINEAPYAFDLRYDVADPDRTRVLGKSHAASAALQCINITRLYQCLHGFLEVMRGNAKYQRNVGRSCQIARPGNCKIHQEPQR